MTNSQLNETEIFMPYQRAWLEDKSALKIIEKSRRCGISWADASQPPLDGALADGGVNTYYFSFNKDNCRQYIEDCAAWAKTYNILASAVQEVVINDEDRDITVYRIELASGHEVMGLPGVPRAIRSKQGNVVIDEGAYIDDFDGVLQAAKALVMWGGTIRVISTHNGDDNPFNNLIKDIRAGRETEWSLHRVTFRDSVQQGLYKRICLKHGEQWSQAKEDEWVAKMYRIYRDNPDEELDVVPRASGQRYIARSLLDRATDKDVQIVRLEFKDDFLNKKDEVKEREVRGWFSYNVEPLLRSWESSVFYGMDFARSGDLSIYWLSEEIDKTSLACRMIIEIRNAPFESQQLINDLINDALKERSAFGGGAIDSVGNGAQIAEHAAVRYPGSVIQVKESMSWYAEFFPKLKADIEDLTFSVPDDETIKSDFSIVTLKNGIPCIPDMRTADRDSRHKRHGDGAVASVLCVCAWEQCAADPAPSFTAVKPKEQKRSAFGW